MNVQSSIMSDERRKRLGQYFSGLKVGRLLAAVANAECASSIIDPMVGSGDLIEACIELGAKPALAIGMEIDAAAAAAARERLPDASIIDGSAFDPKTILKLPSTQYDLVIGNPPYVRYQQGAAYDDGIPGAATVRRHLRKSLELIDLEDRERSILIEAAATYSGHADLAVPASILSMALVGPNGRLALVLPQAWLARNYSTQVRNCLAAFFDVETIIEDDSTSWFPHALVKTSLLIARRRPVSSSRMGSAHLHVHLGRKAANNASLVGDLMTGSPHPEKDFAVSLVTGSTFFRGADFLQAAPAHLSSIDESRSGDFAEPVLRRIASQLKIAAFQNGTLSALGVTAGQGLRTGANDFFYVQPSADGCSFTSPLSAGPVQCAPSHLRSAVRDQRGQQHAVLDLRGVALPEDLRAGGKGHYDSMPKALADHVRRAAKALSGKPGRERPIPELSAVRTNVRPARPGRAPRFWYMLPDFQPRHLPDVYIPRVCARRPQAALADRSVLVDANFATLRCEGQLPPTALMAILHSNWVWVWLETAGAVMGGGALKIESTMIERMPIPVLDRQQIEQLTAVWSFISEKRLTNPDHAVDDILFSRSDDRTAWIDSLKIMAQARLSARTKRCA